ncbi:conserved hypothetical protein [metagenome]|uniref:DUF1989 domain-containing protein n=1 Tax=metagenome TaxID=256318 RepID=A0A2P2C2C0_9ZZZZ
MRTTEAAYQASTDALVVDREFYDTVGSARRKLLEEFVIPIRSGRSWVVPAGTICRITAVEGPQVGDLNLWSLHNPRERMWAAKTRQLQAAHVSVYDRLWSTLPYLRPLVTIVADTLADYGVDADGGRVHDLLGSRCDPYTNRLLTGEDFDYNCHSNLTRAILPRGLDESDVHDVLNVFQVTGLNDQDQYYNTTSPAKAGDHLEFFAEIDLLAALSTCPGGDLSVRQFGPDAGDPLDTCRPLGIEVFEPDPDALVGWRSPDVSAYDGFHGLRAPAWGENQ